MNSGQGEIRNPAVLVVDDEETIRLLARAALEKNNFEIHEASNGSQGLSLFEDLRPDLVLLDVIMPDFDGFATCESIRKLPGGDATPILMMTGLDDTVSINRAYEAGATDFITKPINWVLLIHRVRYMLRASRANRELRRSKARLANAQRIAKLGHWDWNIERNSVHWSDELFRIFGFRPQAFKPSKELFLRCIHPEDAASVRDSLEGILAQERPCNMDYRIIHSDGSQRFVHQQTEIIPGEDGKTRWMTGTIQDITELKHAEKQISFLAYYDSLTGLPNRALFKKYLRRALVYAERYEQKLAVLFLDLDLFKRFNDTLGHTVGDLLLKAVTDRLVASLRSNERVSRKVGHEASFSVARLGGDEFVVLLARIKEVPDAAKTTRHILSAFSDPFVIEGHEVFITASIGISLYPFDGQDIETLLKNADTAMYHAKSRGRNNYQFYSESMNSMALERLTLENNLRKALEREEFVLYYQPKLNTQTGKIAAIEALIRWQHPDLGLVLPSEFIPLAEETGLIVPIGEWVLQTACIQNRAWQDAGFRPLRIAVNLSSVQFRQPSRLIQAIRNALSSTGLAPDLLELELTESIIMENEQESIDILKQLKAMGLTISIDDFGTGYSSLSYLRQFPVDALKIDRSFLEGGTDDPGNSSLTAAIILMAHTLNLKAIAEGVETEEQLNFLRTLGCDEVQGFLVGRPLPGSEFTDLLKSDAERQIEVSTGDSISRCDEGF